MNFSKNNGHAASTASEYLDDVFFLSWGEFLVWVGCGNGGFGGITVRFLKKFAVFIGNVRLR